LSSLRQNVLRHLLDLAAAEPTGQRMVARVSQQELADHVGTVREVIGGILRDVKDQGLLLTGRDEIVVIDAPRLRDLTWPREYGAGTRARSQVGIRPPVMTQLELPKLDIDASAADLAGQVIRPDEPAYAAARLGVERGRSTGTRR
jgi:hypothetical protein